MGFNKGRMIVGKYSGRAVSEVKQLITDEVQLNSTCAIAIVSSDLLRIVLVWVIANGY